MNNDIHVTFTETPERAPEQVQQDFVNAIQEDHSRFADFKLKCKKLWWSLKYKIRYRGKQPVVIDAEQQL